MIGDFATALGTALGTFKTDVSAAISSNTPVILGVALGIAGLFLVWRVATKLMGAKK